MRRELTDDGGDYENKRPVKCGEVQCQSSSPYIYYRPIQSNVNRIKGLTLSGYRQTVFVFGILDEDRRESINRMLTGCNRYRSTAPQSTEQSIAPQGHARQSIDV